MTPLKKISDKKLARLGGKPPFSSITLPRTAVKSSGRPKPNAKRKAKNTLRAFGPAERRAWMKQQPCCVPTCGKIGYSDSAHIENEGMGRRGHHTKTIPLCGRALELVSYGVLSHHSDLDAGNGRDAFETKYGISLADEAAKTEARWQTFLAGN